MKFILITLAIFLVQFSLFQTASNEDLEDAKLLVVKNILNNYVVEGSDIVMKYSIYNIGNQAALNVQLQDENFPPSDFEYASGFRSVKWTKISSGSNVTHVAIVRPRMTGVFNFTSATVSYLQNDKSEKPQIGYSTELGQAYIQNFKEYNRKHASHTIDWILFVVMASPSIAFPFFLWFNSKKKYEAIKKDSKKESKKAE
jgi:translocon-associated protein subunit beta